MHCHTMKYKNAEVCYLFLVWHNLEWCSGGWRSDRNGASRAVVSAGRILARLQLPLVCSRMVKSPTPCSLPPRWSGLPLEVRRWQSCSKKEAKGKRPLQLKAAVAAVLAGRLQLWVMGKWGVSTQGCTRYLKRQKILNAAVLK